MDARTELDARCEEIIRHCRFRRDLIALRVVNMNSLVTRVANANGYGTDLGETEREKMFEESRDLVDDIFAHIKEGRTHDHPYFEIVRAAHLSIGAFIVEEEKHDKAIKKLATGLPASDWVSDNKAHPETRGFGLLRLGVIVGECGNLSNYPNPAKLWRRMGCAPWTYNGVTRMGATWKSASGKAGALPSEEWSAFGYCPRRRSVAYMVGSLLFRGNYDRAIEDKDEGAYPYRRIMLTRKAEAAEKHPDWTKGHCHNHGLLLGTKAFLMDLWRVWNGKPPRYGAKPTEAERAAELEELAARAA